MFIESRCRIVKVNELQYSSVTTPLSVLFGTTVVVTKCGNQMRPCGGLVVCGSVSVVL